jgi:acetolactate synthase I/III small subunit
MSQSRLLSVLVDNKPGVLQRVASMIRRRGFNIDSLSVGPTDDDTVSRMTITVHVGRQQAEQATKQLAKLIDVITIDDITGLRNVAHELVLIRMHAPPGERTELLNLVDIFRGRVVDVAASSVIVEVTGSPEKIDNFIELMRPYGIKELARSGVVALVRGDQARIRLIDFAMDGEQESEAARATDAAGDTTGTV